MKLVVKYTENFIQFKSIWSSWLNLVVVISLNTFVFLEHKVSNFPASVLLLVSRFKSPITKSVLKISFFNNFIFSCVGVSLMYTNAIFMQKSLNDTNKTRICVVCFFEYCYSSIVSIRFSN